MAVTKIAKNFSNVVRTLFSNKTFFPKNYFLWASVYLLIDYFKPLDDKNPFSVERFSSDKLTVNETFLVLLVAYPILVYIDTLSFAKYLKKGPRLYLMLSLGMSWFLFVNHINRFDHFGPDGLINSMFFGLSYLFVVIASAAAFISGRPN